MCKKNDMEILDQWIWSMLASYYILEHVCLCLFFGYEWFWRVQFPYRMSLMSSFTQLRFCIACQSSPNKFILKKQAHDEKVKKETIYWKTWSSYFYFFHLVGMYASIFSFSFWVCTLVVSEICRWWSPMFLE